MSVNKLVLLIILTYIVVGTIHITYLQNQQAKGVFAHEYN